MPVPKSYYSRCPLQTAESFRDGILTYIKAKLKLKYKGQKPLRAFHAKSIGLVRATITVEDLTDESLKVGLFANPKTYDAWIRFSNASGDIEADDEKAVRGMAIKITNPGSHQFFKQHADDNEYGCHDIILSNARVFFPGYGSLMDSGIRAALGNLREKISGISRIFWFHGLKLLQFRKLSIKIANVLEEAYYSGSPYAFGKNKAIKWCAIPGKTTRSLVPAVPSGNFLKEQLIKDVSTIGNPDIGAVYFHLCVQFKPDGDEPFIEDTTIEWETDFKKVATITITREDISTPERTREDETMSFNPANAIVDHQPLGSINFIRTKIYNELAKERSAFLAKKDISKMYHQV